MRRLVCCRRRTEDFSFDFEEQDRVITYNGLESFIRNSCSYDNESGGCSSMSGPDIGVMTDSPDEDASSCSSSKDALDSSFSSQCLLSSKQEKEHFLDEWDALKNLHHLCIKGKAQVTYSMDVSDIEAMKEKFAKLLLGEDISGGTKGISTALALSNAINNLSVSVFGELWKLEPLSEERKSRWRREMDWLLSPTNFMVELVPAKQNGANGGMLEIMTPKARSDVHMTLPALRMLDTMLIEVLDSMVETEFWYAEGGSRAEGRTRISTTRQSKKWWLPTPRVPDSGLSPTQRKRLIFQGKFVLQILKAAKSINEEVLLQMPIPSMVKEALPKSAKASLGEDIYQALATDYVTLEDVLLSLNLKSEHNILETVNRLEGAILAWQQKISDQSKKRTATRYPWNFVRESGSEIERIVVHLGRAEAMLRLLKTRFPNLPHTFIDVTKIQHNKDIGHLIVESYSRVLVGLAFSIISRIGDIIQEDDLKKPSTPIATLKFDLSSDVYLAGITETPPGHIRRSLLDQMNMVDGRFTNRNQNKVPEAITAGTANPLTGRAWWYGTDQA